MARGYRTVWIPEAEGGGSTGYWETAWAAEKQVAPPWLVRALDRQLPVRGRVLEAGCGQAEFVRLLASPGRPVVGVDLALKALVAAHRDDPTLALAGSDVGALPFPDGTFDAVVSLGVVEHLEAGPVELLREHRRVLAPGGVLLITVPQRSWFRAASDVAQLGLRRRTAYPQRGRLVTRRQHLEPTTGPGAFHQYELGRRQFEQLLQAAGLSVVRWTALDVASGIGDLTRGRRQAEPGAAPPEATTAEADGSATASPALAGGGLGGWARRVVLTDEPVGAAGRALRSVAARAFGHIQFVVAVPDGPARDRS
ncbi:MAG: class I SAM-dependent methyltransferase [Acidimicrobiales bacterium]